MKNEVAQLTKIKNIEIKTENINVITQNEVLVKIDSIGICGSDIHYYLEGKIGLQKVKFPFVLGHECSGIIAEIGKSVKNLFVGQKVVIEPANSCDKCEYCLSGRHNLCPDVKFLGTPPINGAFRKYLSVPAKSCFPLPKEINVEQSIIIEPLSVAVHSVDLGELKTGTKIAIIGCGPIGLSILQVAKAAGACEIFAIDILDYRLNTAKKLGATRLINPVRIDPIEYIFSETNGKGVDVTFEASGKKETINSAVLLTSIGGIVVIVGIPKEKNIYFDIFQARRKELVIKNVRRSNKCIERAIELVKSKKVTLNSFITHRFSLKETSKALKLVANYDDNVIKAIIKPFI